MNSFGLGLILNFTDNASAGMRNATNTFQQMSATADSVSSSVSNSTASIVASSYALDSVGSTLLNTGSSILGFYANVSQSIIDTGLEMQGYRRQLQALYGENAFEQKMSQIQEYAKNSVFEVQGLTQAVVTMKAVGIEAMNAVTSSSGNTTQTLMDYASDIAAMFPNMRNAYGTGVNAAMGALKEYIAEGNAMSLKRGAGLDITGLLGEDKGASIEERTRQVADLVEQLGIAGYTTSLMGTPTQQLSRMQDILFNTMSKISDSGVLKRYTTLLTTIADWMDNLYENTERYEAIVSILGDTITSILTPLQSFVDKAIEIADAVIDWSIEHPKLAKNILITVAAIGSFLVVGGLFLKLMSSIGMASAGLSFLKSLPVLLSTVGSAFRGVIAKALPFVALAGVLYYAWTENIFGIRDAVTTAMRDLGTIFSLVGSAWKDNTLTEDEFVKAQQLGILPLIESLLMFKYYWDFLVDGFKEGFSSFFEGLSEALNKLGVLDVDINTLVASFGEFLRSLFEVGAEDKWASIGKAMGEIAGALVTILVVSNALRGVASVLGVLAKVLNIFLVPFKWIWKIGKVLFDPLTTGIGNVIKVLKGGQGVTFFTKLLEVMRAVTSGGIGLKDAMTVVFGGTATTLMGVGSLIGGIATATLRFVKQLKDGFNWVWEIIKWIGIALGVVGAILLGVAAWPAVIAGAIVGVLTLLIVLIKDNWEAICDFFSRMGTWINDNVIQPIANFFVNLWNGIVTGVTNVVNAIKTFFSNIANWIKTNVIDPVVNFVMTYIWPIIAKIGEIIAKIVEIAVVLLKVLAQWIKTNVIDPIVNFFVGLWNKIVEGITAFVEKAKLVINTIVEWINTNIVTPIATFFSNLWNGIVTGVTAFIIAVQTVFSAITGWIKTHIIDPIANFFKGLWEDITAVFDVIADTISSVLKGAVNIVLGFICGVINTVIKGINWAIDVINAIPGVSITKIDLLELPKLAEGGVVDKPTTAVIGEAGQEAVVPLENNTEWIDRISEQLAPKIVNQPKLSSVGNSPVEEHNDYSVTFEAGSVVIQLANATEAELEKVADKLMRIIARKQQLKAMAVRA